MNIIKMISGNGETAELRVPNEGEYVCPVCGDILVGRMPYTEYEQGKPWGGTLDVCPTCETEFGHSDIVYEFSPAGALEKNWKRLRIEWLNRAGWSKGNLRQLSENLDLDTDALKRERDQR
jgi:hypothetical protein